MKIKKQLNYVRNTSLEAKTLIENNIKEGICIKKLHFPNDVFYWKDLKAYYGTCAICHTTYQLNYTKN